MSNRFEGCLALVMIVAAIQHVHMQGNTRMKGKGTEKFLRQIGVECADHGGGKAAIPHQKGAVADVQGGERQGLVHGNIRRAVSADAGLISQCLLQRLPQYDARVLHRVMGIHIQIPLRVDHHADAAVGGQGSKHMVKKTNACVDLGCALSVQ